MGRPRHPFPHFGGYVGRCQCVILTWLCVTAFPRTKEDTHCFRDSNVQIAQLLFWCLSVPLRVKMSNPIATSFQSASGLFRIPIELRREIYLHLINTAGVHITQNKSGVVRLSPCGGCDLELESSGYDRQHPTDKQIFFRRLSSSWGPHWACEEIMVGGDSDSEVADLWRWTIAILRICQLM